MRERSRGHRTEHFRPPVFPECSAFARVRVKRLSHPTGQRRSGRDSHVPGIDREISIAYAQLGVFGLLVLLAAWFGGERLILRPIRSLVRTATRFGRGDLRARAADEPWMAEFAPLAAAFDDMARKLAAREEELRIANQHLE